MTALAILGFLSTAVICAPTSLQEGASSSDHCEKISQYCSYVHCNSVSAARSYMQCLNACQAAMSQSNGREQFNCSSLAEKREESNEDEVTAVDLLQGEGTPSSDFCGFAKRACKLKCAGHCGDLNTMFSPQCNGSVSEDMSSCTSECRDQWEKWEEIKKLNCFKSSDKAEETTETVAKVEDGKHAPEDAAVAEFETESFRPKLPTNCEEANQYCLRSCKQNCVESKHFGTTCKPIDPIECVYTCAEDLESQSETIRGMACFDPKEDTSGEAKEDRPTDITSGAYHGQLHTTHAEVEKRKAASSPPENDLKTLHYAESTSCKAGQLICNRKCFDQNRIEVLLTRQHKSCLSRCQKDYDECHRFHRVVEERIHPREELHKHKHKPPKPVEQPPSNGTEIEKQEDDSLLPSWLPKWMKEWPEWMKWRPKWWQWPPKNHRWDALIGSPWCAEKRSTCEEICENGPKEPRKTCMDRCWTRYLDCREHNRQGPDPPAAR